MNSKIKHFLRWILGIERAEQSRIAAIRERVGWLSRSHGKRSMWMTRIDNSFEITMLEQELCDLANSKKDFNSAKANHVRNQSSQEYVASQDLRNYQLGTNTFHYQLSRKIRRSEDILDADVIE